jgi:hypothetical protein
MNRRVKDISGQPFGYWTAVRFERSDSGVAYWLFRCVCGGEHVRRGDYIRKGLSRSCGCRTRELIATAKRQPRVTVASKRCSACRTFKPAPAFSANSRSPDGLRYNCKDCHSEHMRVRRMDPAKAAIEQEACRRWRAKLSSRASLLWKQYGITIEDYNRLRDEQGGHCAICPTVPDGAFSLCVDHDHNTGAIRGLLCKHCNKALGLLGDTIEGVTRAVDYLRAASTRSTTPCKSTSECPPPGTETASQ